MIYNTKSNKKKREVIWLKIDNWNNKNNLIKLIWKEKTNVLRVLNKWIIKWISDIKCELFKNIE